VALRQERARRALRPSAGPASAIGNSGSSNIAVDLGIWQYGDAFPSGTTPCGWDMRGWAFPLYDPNPGVDASGTAMSAVLGWVMRTGTTQTIRLPSGVYRTYFAGATLSWVGDDTFPLTWPTYDSAGNAKFMVQVGGSVLFDPDLQDKWWRAADSTGTLGYADFCFSSDFVGYIDSADGLDWTIWAPWVDETTELACAAAGADPNYCDATPVFEFGGVRAGWRSTSVPCAGQTLVYRDVSVVYLADAARYVMFAVECDGTGWPFVEGEGGDCSVCTPAEPGNDCGGTVGATTYVPRTPTTRLVYFTCGDPDFGAGTRGPFPVFSIVPDSVLGEWIGVPQAFTDGPATTLFLFDKDAAGGYVYAGLLAMPIADFGAALPRIEAAWDAGLETIVAVLCAVLESNWVNLGKPNIECTVADYPGAPINETVDEHFVFCNARLHLFAGNNTVTGGTQSVPPIVVHAVAKDYFRSGTVSRGAAGAACAIPLALRVGSARSPDPCDAPDEEREDGELHLVVSPFVPKHVLSEFVTTELDSGNADTLDALVRFEYAECNPLDLPAWLGTDEVRAAGAGVPVGVNDPNVYLVSGAGAAMIVHSAALGGLVLLTAPLSVACATDTCP
jgi:hypothetical protein